MSPPARGGPDMRRLTWIVGPPGAGKTTLAKGLAAELVEFNTMLRPLLGSRRVRKGVLAANAALVAAVRATILHPENRHLGPTVVVAGIVNEDALFPLAAEEEVWLVLPPRERWWRQLTSRPTHTLAGEYDDHAYASTWYDRFATWPGRLPVRLVAPPYVPALIGADAGT